MQIRAAKLGVSLWLVCGHSAGQLQPCWWCGPGGHYQPVSVPLYPQFETVTHSLSNHACCCTNCIIHMCIAWCLDVLRPTDCASHDMQVLVGQSAGHQFSE